ncbi:hypothetical protein PENTCL1PPCAC_30856, partial [Pristionchus entomophagus]
LHRHLLRLFSLLHLIYSISIVPAPFLPPFCHRSAHLSLLDISQLCLKIGLGVELDCAGSGFIADGKTGRSEVGVVQSVDGPSGWNGRRLGRVRVIAGGNRSKSECRKSLKLG